MKPLESQRDDGVRAGGAPRRDETGQHADDEQHRPHSRDRQRIGWLDAEQQAANRSPEKHAAAAPAVSPITTGAMLSRTMSLSSCDRCAPSAIQMPISLRRRATEYETTRYG